MPAPVAVVTYLLPLATKALEKLEPHLKKHSDDVTRTKDLIAFTKVGTNKVPAIERLLTKNHLSFAKDMPGGKFASLIFKGTGIPNKSSDPKSLTTMINLANKAAALRAGGPVGATAASSSPAPTPKGPSM